MQLMGILNVTPDSFYDGGKYRRVDQAVRRAEKLVAEGADSIDIGGESTRPGSRPVSLEEELRRVLPVLKPIVRRFPKIPISVDTSKSQVACQALNEGARIINDVSALRADPKMIQVIREFKPIVILMHMRGRPRTMQRSPRYKDVVKEVGAELAERARWAAARGVPKKNIWIDPGIGFGKTPAHNIALIAHVAQLVRRGYPVLLGCSRKSFIGVLNGSPSHPLPVSERLEGSLAAAAWAFLQGVSILRVHDVGATRKALQVLGAFQP